MMPMRGIFLAACWARADSGRAAAPPMSAMNSRRLICRRRETENGNQYSAARACLIAARAGPRTGRSSKLLVERVLDEVVEHAIGLARGRGVVLGDSLHHRLLLGEGVQPSAEIEHLPVRLGAVEF